MEAIERNQIIDKILWGKSLVIVNDGKNQRHSLILRSLTSKENNISHFIYKKELNEALLLGIFTKDDLIDIYRDSNVWTEEDDQKIENLTKQIQALQSQIKDAEFFTQKKKKLQKVLEDVRKKKGELEQTKQQLFLISAENRATEIQRRFTIMMAAETMDEKPLWKTEEDFLNDADNVFLYNLAIAYYENNVFPEKILREIARSPEWRFRWSVAKNGADLFGKSIADWSETQSTLVYWSQYYDSIISSHEYPGDNILCDDESVDAWVREQNKKVANTVKFSKGKERLQNKKHKDHQEQFVFVEKNDNESIKRVQEMNLDSIRKQLREEHEYIKNKGKVSEWDLRVARKGVKK